jgi:DNA-binding XRE family transcriptional regulator
MSVFGDNLTMLRKNREYTRPQISDIIGVPWTTYRSWERGIYEPRIEHIIKLCKLFNVSSDELLGIKKLKGSNLLIKANVDEEIEDEK